MKRTVEDRFGHVKLRGELSGVKRAASGHLYCALKDDGAVIDGVMWRGGAQRLGFLPEDGIEVVATGKLTTYPGRSKYQIVIESMEIAGEGALLALLEKTKARLAAEGLFAPERKRPLPFLPQVIGVVTSSTGAVIRDILHRLEDRFPTHVVVWPVLVQGATAAEQVANAIRGFSALAPGGPVARPDLVIVARGGGSIEDLWCFNEEVVVRAIAESTIPTISAVGHETDTTLADFAADMRAPTPTAAAEMAVPVRRDLANFIAELGLRQRRSALRPVELGRERLAARAERLPRADSLLAPYSQALDDAAERLRRGLSDRAARARQLLQSDAARLSAPLLRARVAQAKQQLEGLRLSPTVLQRTWEEQNRQLASIGMLLKQLHPNKPLKRGYAMVLDASGKPVISRSGAAKADRLTLRFSDGEVAVAPLDAAQGASAASGEHAGKPAAVSQVSVRARRKPASPEHSGTGEQPKLL